MSRTYRVCNNKITRRKEIKKRTIAIYKDWTWRPSIKEAEKYARRQYTDGNTDHNMMGCASWFRRRLNRELRRKNKAILNKQLNYIDKEFIPFKKTALWLWW